MTKKRQWKQTTHKVPNSQAVQVVTYEITDAPILDRHYRRLPQEVKDAINRLHSLSQRRPSEAIPELLEWIAHYPEVPVFYNYLSVAYSFSGQRDKAEAAIEDNYQRNPDYLFARIHYGELCLTRRDYDRIAEVLDHKFDLKLLYPKRKRFHVSEVMGFMGLVGVYFFETGQCETAEKYYAMMNQIDSTHPFTKRLRRELHPGLIRRLFRLVRKH